MDRVTVDFAVSARRDLHRIPETGLAEFKTQAYILKALEGMGLSGESAAGTGVVCFIDFGKDHAVALRCDIDALPVTEETGCGFESQHPGFMHACGHDAHTAMMLGVARWLSGRPEGVASNVLLIFQPAEEQPGGAKEIIATGVFEKRNVKKIYGFHLMPGYPFGAVASKPGEFFASAVEIYIDIEGESAHGAKQYLGRDALLAACSLVSDLTGLINKTATPFQEAVLNFGVLRAGDRLNVVAQRASIQGSLRTYDMGLRDRIISRMDEMCRGCALTHGVAVKFTPVYFYPALVNDAALFEETARILPSMLTAGKEMVSEDFSYYAGVVPALFMLLGIDDGKPEHSYSLHSSKFAFDDSVLEKGIDAYAAILTGAGA